MLPALGNGWFFTFQNLKLYATAGNMVPMMAICVADVANGIPGTCLSAPWEK